MTRLYDGTVYVFFVAKDRTSNEMLNNEIRYRLSFLLGHLTQAYEATQLQREDPAAIDYAGRLLEAAHLLPEKTLPEEPTSHVDHRKPLRK